MDGTPLKAATVDRLIGISSDEDSIGGCTERNQGSDCVWIQVLRFVNEHRVVFLGRNALRDKIECDRSVTFPTF